MSTPTHRKKRARTTGANAKNDTEDTITVTKNNAGSHSQNLTTQLNDMKNEFEMKLTQVTNIQRDQQYQLELLRSENTKLIKNNKELRHELNQVKEKTNSDKTEYEAKMNDFKKQLEEMNKDSTGDSRSGSSVKAFENDELSNAERSTVIQEVQSRLPTIINDVKNIKKTKELSLHDKCINSMLIFTSKNNEKMKATACRDSHIKITRIGNKNLVETIENANSRVITSLTMTKINNTDVIASGSYDKMVKLWNIDNFQEVASFECSDIVLSLVAYELNGKHMLACGLLNESIIELWDVQSKKKVYTLKDNYFRVCVLFYGVWELHTFKYQNKTYLLSGDMYIVNLWCLDDENKLVKTLRLGYCHIGSLATFEFDNDLFIAAGLEKKVDLWRMSTLEPYHQFDFQGDKSVICGLKPFTSNGKVMLATVNDVGWFRVLDIEGKKVVHKVNCTNHEFSSLDVCEVDENSVFIASGENIKTNKGCVVLFK